jgi:hypothetical protein
MRSAVEEQLNLIARGQADYLAVLRHAKEIFAAKFLYFVGHIPQMDLLFEATFSTLAQSGKPFSRLVMRLGMRSLPFFKFHFVFREKCVVLFRFVFQKI